MNDEINKIIEKMRRDKAMGIKDPELDKTLAFAERMEELDKVLTVTIGIKEAILDIDRTKITEDDADVIDSLKEAMDAYGSYLVTILFKEMMDLVKQ